MKMPGFFVWTSVILLFMPRAVADWESSIPGKPEVQSLTIFPIKVSGLGGPDKYKGDPSAIETAFWNHLFYFLTLNAAVDLPQAAPRVTVPETGDAQAFLKNRQLVTPLDPEDILATEKLFKRKGEEWFSTEFVGKSLAERKVSLGLIVEVYEIFYQGKNGLYEVKCRYAIVGRKGRVLTKGALSFKNPRVTLLQKEAWGHTFSGVPNGEPYALFARELLKVLNTVL